MKKRNSKTPPLLTAAAVIMAAVLTFAVFQALRIYIPQQQAQNGFDELKRLAYTQTADGDTQDAASDFDRLTARNGDFAGWLTIEDTVIDYPVMKSAEDDPEYYLRRNFDGEYSRSGCLFIGGGCNINSASLIIYGHNMSSDTMFGTLDAYASADFAAGHAYIRLDTPNGQRIYKVFAAFRTRLGGDGFQYDSAVGDLDETSYRQAVEAIRAMSLIDLADAPVYPAQLLMLSTCSYHTADRRFVVAAYRIS